MELDALAIEEAQLVGVDGLVRQRAGRAEQRWIRVEVGLPVCLGLLCSPLSG